MALVSSQASRATGSNCKLFTLPRELRDAIWVSLIKEDIPIFSDLYADRFWHGYEDESTFPSLTTMISLLRVNMQIKDEVTAVFTDRNIFSFQSSIAVTKLIETLCCCYPRQQARRGSPPRIFLKIGHLSVLPQGIVHSREYPEGLVSALHCSSARAGAWRNRIAGMPMLLRKIRTLRMELRILEIPAMSLFSIDIVRQLRQLRGVTLHLVFVSESTMQEGLVLHEGTTASQQKQIWLGETGETDVVLPIYETHQEIGPLAVAPLSCFAAAIRREAASTTRLPLSATHAQADPPFWVEFNSEHVVATNGLSPPSSGWYTYSARDPGVCCLEKTTAPIPPMPAGRKRMKHFRQEKGRLSTMFGPFYIGNIVERKEMVDVPRAGVIEKMGIPGVIIKNKLKGVN